MNQVEALLKELKDYISLRLQITQLKYSSKTSLVTSSVLTYMLISMVVFFFVLVLTIGIALWMGNLLGEWYLGFLIMAGIYLLIGLVIFTFRNRWIRIPLNNLIIKEIFDED
ncbi:MAG: hypothetical protein IPG01_05630 [Chitinophagaceae bacterium]|nr:hypothetical protein [Chitinophagaceae bacterium]